MAEAQTLNIQVQPQPPNGKTNPTDLNPELVRFKMVEQLANADNVAFSELTPEERLARARIHAINISLAYKDAQGNVCNGLPMTMAFLRAYEQGGHCLERKRADEMVAMLRPKSGSNYKLGWEGEEAEPGLVQKAIAMLTGKKEQKRTV